MVKWSENRYPAGYTHKDILWQSNRLREFFPGLGSHDEEAAKMAVPVGAEGPFAIPRWQVLGRSYNESFLHVLEKLSELYGGRFENKATRELGSANLCENEKHKKDRMVEIARVQRNSDILIVHAQFGLKRSESYCHWPNLYEQIHLSDEFALGGYEVGCMLLTHPERLQNEPDLWVKTPGDVGRSGSQRWGDSVLEFSYGKKGLTLDWALANSSGSDTGYATAVCPPRGL